MPSAKEITIEKPADEVAERNFRRLQDAIATLPFPVTKADIYTASFAPEPDKIHIVDAGAGAISLVLPKTDQQDLFGFYLRDATNALTLLPFPGWTVQMGASHAISAVGMTWVQADPANENYMVW